MSDSLCHEKGTNHVNISVIPHTVRTFTCPVYFICPQDNKCRGFSGNGQDRSLFQSFVK